MIYPLLPLFLTTVLGAGGALVFRAPVRRAERILAVETERARNSQAALEARVRELQAEVERLRAELEAARGERGEGDR